MKYWKWLVWLLAAYLIASCVYMAEAECRTDLWLILFSFISILLLVSASFYMRKKYIRQQKRLARLQFINEQEHKKNLAVQEFIHQYKSNLIALRGLAEQSDFAALQEYIFSLTQDFEFFYHQADYFSLAPLSNSALYWLLVSEFQFAERQHVKLSFAANEISCYLLKTKDLISVVSILCENAIEAAAASEEKKVDIQIMQQEEGVAYRFFNTTGRAKVEIAHIFEEGYSTKPEKSGIGLGYVKKILKQYDNADYFVDCSDGGFCFYLKITRR